MKNLIKFSAFLFVLVSFSCSDESCEAGFEGENCDVLVNQKFFGTYTLTSSQCGMSGNSSSIASMVITENVGGDAQSVMVELARSVDVGSAVGTIVDGALDVSVDVGSVNSTITGTITESTFSGSETASQGAISVVCTIEMDR